MGAILVCLESGLLGKGVCLRPRVRASAMTAQVQGGNYKKLGRSLMMQMQEWRQCGMSLFSFTSECPLASCPVSNL